MRTYVLDKNSTTPLYLQLYDHIRRDIEEGRLSAGEKLPSKRAFAAHLKVSQNTVETAYEQLVAEGYVFSRPRSGYYVGQAIAKPLPNQASLTALPPMPKRTAYPLDFSTNRVDTGSFPFTVWARLTREVLSEGSHALLTPSDLQGDTTLRREIARYLLDYRGIACDPEQIVVGAGSEYLLGLAISLLGHQSLYAVEDPGYLKITGILGQKGAQSIPISVDRHGIDPQALRQSGATAAHITPSHQYPLGTIMPVARRQQLLAWAAQSNDRYILEDDYDSEFRFSGRPVPALQSLDTAGKVIYFNTFSKSLAPSLRIGYMVLPPTLLAQYRKLYRTGASTVSSFEQQVLCRFLQRGHFERHLRRMRRLYKARCDALIAILKSLPIQVTIHGQDTGLHVLAALPTSHPAKEIAQKAAEKGVGIYPLSRFYSNPDKAANALVLGYAGMTPEQIAEAGEILRTLV